MPNRKASDIMNPAVVTFRPDTDIYQAIKTFLKQRFSGAPVVDDDHRVVGILSEKDCLRVLTGEIWDGLPEGNVGDYMTHPVSTVEPDTTILDIAGRFLTKPYRRLPVLGEDGRLVGQISRRDVLGAIDSMRDNTFLYGSQDHQLNLDEGPGAGVDTAMRIARGL